MSSEEAGKLLFAMGMALILAGPLSGLIIEFIKIMMRMAIVGLALQLLPFDFIDQWSKQATGWLNVTTSIAPGLALLAIFALANDNVGVIPEKIEKYARLAMYIIAGATTAGSVAWITWDQSMGSIVTGVFGVLTGTIAIFSEWLPSR